MASPNATFTEMVTTTMRHRKTKVVDNVTKHNALLRVLKEKGHIQTDASGGTEIVLPISYNDNSTYQRYYGGEVLNIQDSDVLTAAKYDWMQVALHVTATGRELKLNAGKEQMINLVKARTKVAMATAANNMSVDIYSDGSLANQITGLAALCTTNGQGTIGGINAATYPFWANKFKEVAGTGATYATLRAAMNDLWLSLVRGQDKPDLIVMSHDFYSLYESGLQDLQRYSDSRSADAGYQELKYKSASVIFDDNTNFGTTSETAFFINTDYLHLREHPEARWTEDDEKTPINQDKVIVPIYWMGNLGTDRRAGLGRLMDAA